MANKLHLAIGLIIVVIAFIGLYVYFSSAPAAAPVQNETVLNVEVNKTNADRKSVV